NKTKAYGAANPAFTATYSGFVNSETSAVLGGTLAFTTTATQTSAVGSYPITPTGLTSGNYDITFTDGALHVTTQTLTITAENKTKVYGAANPAFTVTYSGFSGNDTAASLGGALSYNTTATVASGAGTYSVTPAGLTSSNYTISFVAGTLTVTKAALTVTAENKIKVYGAANPALTAAYNGFVNNDTVSALGGALTLSTTATAASGAGSYPITAAGLTSANYNLTFTPGALNVTKADPTISLTSGANPAFRNQAITLTATLTKAAGDTGNPTGTVLFREGATQLGTGTINASGQAMLTTAALSVGDHAITAEYGGDGNYTQVSGALTQTINKAATTTTLVSSANPATTGGQAVSFSATVASTAGAPTGAVEFRDGTTVLGTVTLAGGVASMTTSTLTAGEHAITAVYAGDANFATSTGALTQTMRPACQFQVTGTSTVIDMAGGAFTAAIATANHCPWTAISHDAWITINGASGGTGDGTVFFTIAAHTGNTVREGTLTVAGRTFTLKQGPPATTVSAASYKREAMAANSIASIFGQNLAAETVAATTQPLPTTLGGVRVRITDSAGTVFFAALLYVSPGQINYVIPTGMATGAAEITVINGETATGIGPVEIRNVAPGLFTADASGTGAPRGYYLRVGGDGQQNYNLLSRFDTALNRQVLVPFDLSVASAQREEVYLVLFGTGWRDHSGLGNVRVTIGGVEVEVLYAGAQADFTGLDQLNMRLPAGLRLRGDVDLILTVDGHQANPVRISFE
ncbi:MAG: MBG domain-containing protein, partial [Blastocatellia bacterium]